MPLCHRATAGRYDAGMRDVRHGHLIYHVVLYLRVVRSWQVIAHLVSPSRPSLISAPTWHGRSGGCGQKDAGVTRASASTPSDRTSSTSPRRNAEQDTRQLSTATQFTPSAQVGPRANCPFYASAQDTLSARPIDSPTRWNEPHPIDIPKSRVALRPPSPLPETIPAPSNRSSSTRLPSCTIPTLVPESPRYFLCTQGDRVFVDNCGPRKE